MLGRSRPLGLQPAQAGADDAAEKLAAGDRWQGSGRVFATELGGPVEPRNLYRAVLAAAKRAVWVDDDGVQQTGLKVTAHMLRHTARTGMVDAGVPLTVVRDLFGHGSISETKRYAHGPEASARAAVDGWAKQLGEGEKYRHGSPPQPGAADLYFDDEYPMPAATLRHRSHARITTAARRWARAEQPGRRPGALRLGRGLDGVPAVLDRRSRPQWPLWLGRRLDGVPAGSNGSWRQLQPGGNHAYDRLHVVSEWRLRLQSACSSALAGLVMAMQHDGTLQVMQLSDEQAERLLAVLEAVCDENGLKIRIDDEL